MTPQESFRSEVACSGESEGSGRVHAILAIAVEDNFVPGGPLAYSRMSRTSARPFQREPWVPGLHSIPLTGLLAALFVALGAELISRSSRIKEDTSMGILYTVAFSLGIVLLSFAKVRVELHHYLFGNIFGLANADLWIIYAICLIIVPLLVLLQRPLLLMLFESSIARSRGVPVTVLNYLLISMLVLSMISSLQAVGVILALGLLTAPAATIYLFSNSFSTLFWGGGLLGMLGSCVGLLLSYWLNIPSGACIVLVPGLVFRLAYLFSPRYGIISKLLRHSHLHEESLARWKLREAEKVEELAVKSPE